MRLGKGKSNPVQARTWVFLNVFLIWMLMFSGWCVTLSHNLNEIIFGYLFLLSSIISHYRFVCMKLSEGLDLSCSPTWNNSAVVKDSSSPDGLQQISWAHCSQLKPKHVSACSHSDSVTFTCWSEQYPRTCFTGFAIQVKL